MKTLDFWIKWKKENKKAYYRLHHLAFANGIFLGLLLGYIFFL